MLEKKQRVVIIGGGITGLATAYYLQKQAIQQNLPFEVKLIEASHRLGGKMQTVVQNGYVIERGPDSFLERKQSALRLANEVGLSDKLVNNSAGQSFIFANQRLYPMPGGSIMGIPTEVAPFITTQLFSVTGKMRAAADLIIPRSRQKEDQSLGHFFRRRLGDEVLENLIEPLLSGIYAGDIDQLSLQSTFPQFYQVEQKYRSLILGMRKSTPTKPKSSTDTEAKKGQFITVATGLQSFVEAIEAKLLPQSVIKGYRVESVRKVGEEYEVELNSRERIIADSVVVAVPHYVAASIFSQYKYFSVFKEVPATSVATVALAFSKSAIKKDIDGTGFVVSRNSDSSITACTWTHKKWPHSTPEGKVLLRCYVGRPGHETIVDLSDDQIINIVLDDLNKTMAITEKPELSVVTRWKDSMPQYTVGHQKRLEYVTNQVAKDMPGVYLAGSSYRGIGVPDCIDQAEATVEKVLNFLRK
ncbi:protoporphyrinogen oxidase [Bacillus sp. DNRA2]|uniref:protoporphyrinogen oxidase n=1 Tax=Bacillus sp. DNRA2 TaxID=2723053 RepID=UPI00145CD82A|nr:protoporphyrinogen oxidase [Bacillus sp. DNRA2]NMD72056.1 protoporphyrinogen oxidase [Bacillus sp. DNRA2]